MAALPPEQRRLFEEPNLVAVSTLAADGSPRVTVAWVDVDGDDILLNSAEHRNWPKNLRRDPRVGLCVFDRNKWVRNVTVIGRVKSMTTEGGWEHIQALSQKYDGKPYAGATDRVIIRIEVERSFGYSL
ncbi:MAG TPA: TIGR03618 family F420-dependent PPOX class oxidoreductase [Candidatus Solibacter sp.]|jgi:PPOX class probable F420-dependent enzyme|nr:TIGR03618 family F420-dependent PPOX class oxidoreductase [Candidatus Solibacter sp.]